MNKENYHQITYEYGGHTSYDRFIKSWNGTVLTGEMVEQLLPEIAYEQEDTIGGAKYYTKEETPITLTSVLNYGGYPEDVFNHKVCGLIRTTSAYARSVRIRLYTINDSDVLVSYGSFILKGWGTYDYATPVYKKVGSTETYDVKGIANGASFPGVSSVTINWFSTDDPQYFPNESAADSANDVEKEFIRYIDCPLIPIFETEADLEAYVRTGDISGVINADTEFGEDSTDYYLYTWWSPATAKNGQITRTGSNTHFYERILANGNICLKKTAEPNQYTITGGIIVGSAYSSINKYSCEQIEKKDFLDHLISAGPVYDMYRNSYGDGTFTLGEGDLNSTFITNIPFFADPEKADKYIAGQIPIEEADNYSYISGGIGSKTNPTGEPEERTELSLNLTRGVFAADYCMSRTGLVNLATDFFSSSFWEDLKDGLKYYGNRPMSAVSSCVYFPFDISTIFDIVGVNYVSFGSYSHDVTGKGISKITWNKGVKDLGSTFIRPTFNNFLDFAAVEIYCFLPYIGFVSLQTDKYMGKNLEIKYSIDIHSGECSAMLFANGTLMDTYDGQIGIVNPITSEDLAGYAQAQISGIKSALGSVAGGGITGAMAGAKGGAYGAAAGAIVGTGLGAVNAGLTAYGLMNMKPQLFSSGGYSGALGANLPQYAFLVFAIHETEEPANLIQTHGKPSNRSGLIGDFSGFLSVNSVNLNCGDATEAEKAEILQLLYSGIII